jgi:hypothetical protein
VPAADIASCSVSALNHDLAMTGFAYLRSSPKVEFSNLSLCE